jgi:leader peptidase (prepilin peptidase)/N-methyltransferase
MLFQGSVLILSGLYIFYTDLKYRKITNWTNIFIFIAAFVYTIYDNVFIEHILASLIIGLFFLIMALVTKGFGMGDVKYIYAITFLLGFKIAMYGFLIGVLLGGIYALFLVVFRKAKASDTFAYGPFLVIGQILGFLISII